MDRDTLSKQLEKVELDFDFNDGYQLLYCPWDTLGSHEMACISINPSLREGHRKRMLSDDVSGRKKKRNRQQKVRDGRMMLTLDLMLWKKGLSIGKS